jgi:hypothetical protein
LILSGTSCVTLPGVPAIFTVVVPVVAVALAVKVTVLVLVAGSGVNAAVTPSGRPIAERVTLPVNPSAGVTVIVVDALFPCDSVRLVGFAVRV